MHLAFLFVFLEPSGGEFLVLSNIMDEFCIGRKIILFLHSFPDCLYPAPIFHDFQAFVFIDCRILTIVFYKFDDRNIQ